MAGVLSLVLRGLFGAYEARLLIGAYRYIGVRALYMAMADNQQYNQERMRAHFRALYCPLRQPQGKKLYFLWVKWIKSIL